MEECLNPRKIPEGILEEAAEDIPGGIGNTLGRIPKRIYYKYLEEVLTKISGWYSETNPGEIRERIFKGIHVRMSGETLNLRKDF